MATKEKAALEVGSALRTSQLPKASVSCNVHLFCLDNQICSPSLSHEHSGLVCKNCLFTMSTLHVTPGLALEDSRLATLGEEVEVLISFHQYDQYIMRSWDIFKESRKIRLA